MMTRMRNTYAVIIAFKILCRMPCIMSYSEIIIRQPFFVILSTVGKSIVVSISGASDILLWFYFKALLSDIIAREITIFCQS